VIAPLVAQIYSIAGPANPTAEWQYARIFNKLRRYLDANSGAGYIPENQNYPAVAPRS